MLLGLLGGTHRNETGVFFRTGQETAAIQTVQSGWNDLHSRTEERHMNHVLHLAQTQTGQESTMGAVPFKAYTTRNFDEIPQLARLSEDTRFAMRVVAEVMPFRVNSYVLENLIDWDNVPEDPIFQLTFPQPGMLFPDDLAAMSDLIRRDAPRDEIERLAWDIRHRFNPHPAGQMELNVPTLDGKPLTGIQHKYDETVLFFPSKGQTCHSYCSFCYRWAQFAGDESLRFAANDSKQLRVYLERHPEVSDLLLTGGDPLVMGADNLAAYLDPILAPETEHVQSIRIGTKTLTYWPQRFVTDRDADDLLRLFERISESGRQLSIMAHFNHWREMEPAIAREAIRRIRDTGAVIRTQSPLLAHINDDASVWARLWRTQVGLGLVPYYMFVERDTGARHYFEVPLARVWEIFRSAYAQVSGLSRTVRGPSMSATPGKVEVQGVSEVAGEKVFALRFIQGREANWVQRPFFARFDESATWFDDLRPAFGEDRFFFEDEFDAIRTRSAAE